MELRDQSFENRWVRLEPIAASTEVRDFVKASGAVEAMWKWLPRLPERGTTYEAYYEHVMAKANDGSMIPLFAHDKMTGAFAGGANFMDMSRTHRSARIGYMWVPPHLRGTSIALATQAAMIQGAINWRAKRVFWFVDVLNTRQVAFLENKVGAQKEGVFESVARMNDGRWSDIAVYALVGDRLENAVEQIEARLEIEFAETD